VFSPIFFKIIQGRNLKILQINVSNFNEISRLCRAFKADFSGKKKSFLDAIAKVSKR
jgi:hypothetical protein